MSRYAIPGDEFYATRREQLQQDLNNAVEAGDIERGYELLHQIQQNMEKQTRASEIEQALQVLDKHGVAYRVWSRDDVYKALDSLPNMDPNHKDLIVDHVVGGDDWQGLEDAANEAGVQKIWEIISGTASDHPEWFSVAAARKL